MWAPGQSRVNVLWWYLEVKKGMYPKNKKEGGERTTEFVGSVDVGRLIDWSWRFSSTSSFFFFGYHWMAVRYQMGWIGMRWDSFREGRFGLAVVVVVVLILVEDVIL
jgi:hypothetical protein